jgi:hypothetical protein
VTVHGSMGLPSIVDNFTLRFAEMDQLQEPDSRSTQKWLEEVVRASAIDYNNPFKIRTKDDVTPEYLNGMHYGTIQIIYI